MKSTSVRASKMPMYIIIIALALILAFAFVSMTAKHKPHIISKDNIMVVYPHSKEEDVNCPYRFSITAISRGPKIPADGIAAYWLTKDQFKSKYPNLTKSDFNMHVLESTKERDFYAGAFPPLEKNDKYYFFIEVTDKDGKSFTLPEDALTTKSFYHVTYKQNPNKWGLIVHILLMMVALLFLIHAFYYALNYIWNRADWNVNKSVSCIFWGVLSFGISAFPIGMWIEYEKYGTFWTGFPLGWDITDTKTLFNFLYWFSILILMKGTLLKKDPQKNIVGNSAFAWLTLLGAVLTMVVRFVIPHGDL